MAAEAMLSKPPVLRITVALFLLLKLFSSHIYCIPRFNVVIHSDVQRMLISISACVLCVFSASKMNSSSL